MEKILVTVDPKPCCFNRTVLVTFEIKIIMGFKHVFKAKLDWLFSKKEAAKYTKSHSISIDGKAVLHVSAAKAFKGDPALYNPEDLLLSSVVSVT